MHKIWTDSIELDGYNGTKIKKGKLFIELKKADGYDDAVADFEKIRVERQ
jgi:hypothetical protein